MMVDLKVFQEKFMGRLWWGDRDEVGRLVDWRGGEELAGVFVVVVVLILGTLEGWEFCVEILDYLRR